MRQCYLIEFGTGIDIHGGSMTKAAQKAVKDAISHCCMAGLPKLMEMCGVGMEMEIRIGVPVPEAVDRAAVLAVLPEMEQTVSLEIVAGGMLAKRPDHTQDAEIVIANATITVYLASVNI